MSRKRTFNSPEEVEKLYEEYLDKCIKDGMIPTIVGFTLSLGISRSNYYEYKAKEAFSEVFETIDLKLEESTIQSMFKCKNPIPYIFYMKNKFGYSDKMEVRAEAQQQGSSLDAIDVEAILREAEDRQNKQLLIHNT